MPCSGSSRPLFFSISPRENPSLTGVGASALPQTPAPIARPLAAPVLDSALAPALPPPAGCECAARAASDLAAIAPLPRCFITNPLPLVAEQDLGPCDSRLGFPLTFRTGCQVARLSDAQLGRPRRARAKQPLSRPLPSPLSTRFVWLLSSAYMQAWFDSLDAAEFEANVGKLYEEICRLCLPVVAGS